MFLLYIIGAVVVLFAIYFLVLFGYELWKDSALRKDLLEKKKQRMGE